MRGNLSIKHFFVLKYGLKIPEVDNKMQIGFQTAIYSIVEVRERKMKLERD